MVPSSSERYSRQIRYSGFGEEGQERVARSRVAVVGCGALGSAQAEILARAGVGVLRLIDRDYVELSNLQRQSLFDEADAREALPKAIAASRRLRAVNSTIEVEPVVDDLTALNAMELLGDVDLILDGTDNFETRYLINDLAVSRGTPWIYGAAVGSYGLKMAILPEKTACLACVYPEPPQGVQPTCETAGVLAPITLTIAALQCADAMLVLTRNSDAVGRLITTVDVWTGLIRQVPVPNRDPNCSVCSRREFRYLENTRRTPVSLCGRNAVQIHERSRPINLEELARQLAPVAGVRANEFALRATISAYELTVFPDGRAIIKGTTDIGVARSIYAQYVGI